VDTGGNGFRLTNAAEGVDFDFVGNGRKVRTAWTTIDTDDAFLALDLNGNGAIDNGTELFGNYTQQSPSPNPNGFNALLEYDKIERGGNGDNRISERDAIYPSLLLWKDKNHNGISEASEISRLSTSDVDAVDLNYEESKRIDQHGNEYRYRSRVLDSSPGAFGRWAWDVFFAISIPR
jgi:hypothetical protein